MSTFALAVDAMFDDPNMAEDAIWRIGGTGVGVSVRLRRRSPEAVVGLGGNQFDLNAMLIDVRLSEAPTVTRGDTFAIQDGEGDVIDTLEVIGLSSIDARKLVRTCEVSPLGTEPDGEAGGL